MDHLFDLLKRFAALRRAPRTSKGKYPAPQSPYKPLLLLTVLRRIQQGKAPYASNEITYSVCAQDYAAIYTRLYGDSSGMESKVTQPFWYLGTGVPKIWNLIAKAGKEDQLLHMAAVHAQIKTAPKLSELVESARFSEDDWPLVSDADVQKALISFLLSEHFPDIRHEIDVL